MLLVALLLIGIPVGYCIGMTSIVALVIKWGYPNLSFGLIAQMLVYGINNFPILAVPLFLLTGALMNMTGISSRIFNFAGSIVGHTHGGLAHVNILASFIFSGMSGAAAADAAGLGQIEIKAMKNAGYDLDFSCAVTAASSTIGPIVPPSVPLVLYGVLATTSVSRLFIGGIVPGILMVVTMMILCFIISKKRNYPKGDRFRLNHFVHTFKRAFFPIMTPVIIIGGIWTGIFTPTEAAAIAALYSLVLGFFFKEINLKSLINTFREVSITGSAILMILACAMIYNSAITRTQVPETITNLLFSISENPIIILLLLNALILMAGMFMSTAETITLFTPLIAPLLPKFGIDPIHFGVMMVLNLMIGQLTPPFGIVLYVVMRVGEIDFDRLVKACIPFYIPIFIVLLLILFFPPFVTYLPDLVFGHQ